MNNITYFIDSALSQGQKEWQAYSFSQRVETLLQWSHYLAEHPDFGVLAAKMVRFQCQRAQNLIAEIELMPGPTGESNELYTAARGVFYITSDESSSVVAIVGQITAALVAGNAIIVALQNDEQNASVIVEGLHQANVPTLTAQQINAKETDVDDVRLAGVCFVGSKQKEIQLNQQLAQRGGLLAQLIAETDQERLPNITDPHFVLRFITERTRTINVTAVGGNATLLELGGGNH